MYAIIADWDGAFNVSRYNFVDTEVHAIALVDRLVNGTPYPEFGSTLSLPSSKRAPNAYFVLMPPAPIGTENYQHRSRFWKAEPIGKTMSFDVAACHAWQTKITSIEIDTEADRRIDKVFSPNKPGRARRVRDDLPEGPTKIGMINRATALRVDAETLKTSLASLNPEEVRLVGPSNNAHWSE